MKGNWRELGRARGDWWAGVAPDGQPCKRLGVSQCAKCRPGPVLNCPGPFLIFFDESFVPPVDRDVFGDTEEEDCRHPLAHHLSSSSAPPQQVLITDCQACLGRIREQLLCSRLWASKRLSSGTNLQWIPTNHSAWFVLRACSPGRRPRSFPCQIFVQPRPSRYEFNTQHHRLSQLGIGFDR